MPLVNLTKHNDNYISLTINNPESRNLMTPELIEELNSHLDNINTNPKIKVAVIDGEGKSFSLGLDLPLFIEKYKLINSDNAKTEKELYNLIKMLQNTFKKISESQAIFIASVHKHVYGAGLDLISWCDIRIGTDNSRFCISETDLEIVADLGSLNNLPYIIGSNNTNFLALTGKSITAQEALHMGLLNQLTKNESLHEETYKIASGLLAKPGSILKNLKRSMNFIKTVSHADGLDYLAKLNSRELLHSGILQKLMKSKINS